MEAQDIRTALLNDIDNWVTSTQFGKTPKYLHVVIINDDEDMLQVAKQMALLAHFPSFDENNPDTRTKISILGKAEDAARMNEVFGNLLVLQNMGKQNGWIDVPLDVQVEYVIWNVEKKSIIKEWVDACEKDVKKHLVKYDKADIIRLSKTKEHGVLPDRELLAMRASMVYEASQTFEIIRAENIANVAEYETPIRLFLEKDLEGVKRKWSEPDYHLLKKSNLCLAESICVRAASLRYMRLTDDKSLYDTLTRNLAAMSKSEHARWNVEKLIHGFRPYSKSEVIEDENLSGDIRAARISYLKKNESILAHIDLCSYSRLRRIDLESIKYDSFLLLAMVRYLEK